MKNYLTVIFLSLLMAMVFTETLTKQLAHELKIEALRTEAENTRNNTQYKIAKLELDKLQLSQETLKLLQARAKKI